MANILQDARLARLGELGSRLEEGGCADSCGDRHPGTALKHMVEKLLLTMQLGDQSVWNTSLKELVTSEWQSKAVSAYYIG